LRKIAPEAWRIVGTTIRSLGSAPENEEVPFSGTTVPFTEGTQPLHGTIAGAQIAGSAFCVPELIGETRQKNAF